MTERTGRGARGGETSEPSLGEELKEKRDAFLHTFFKRGAELTEELVGENRRLQERLAALEEENAGLKTQLASDKAIRDLLKKIEELEREKARLLSTVHSQAEITNRFAEIESELESFANLYVASFQLHISLRVRTVVRHVRELLVQLVGVRSLAVYFVDAPERNLVPIATDGVDIATVPKVPLRDLRDGASSDPVEAIVERTYLTGVLHVAEGEGAPPPVACIPLQFEERTVGVIVVYSLLQHKRRLVTVDRELFKLLGAHAGGALVSSFLWAQGGSQLPSAEALVALCA